MVELLQWEFNFILMYQWMNSILFFFLHFKINLHNQFWWMRIHIKNDGFSLFLLTNIPTKDASRNIVLILNGSINNKQYQTPDSCDDGRYNMHMGIQHTNTLTWNNMKRRRRKKMLDEIGRAEFRWYRWNEYACLLHSIWIICDKVTGAHHCCTHIFVVKVILLLKYVSHSVWFLVCVQRIPAKRRHTDIYIYILFVRTSSSTGSYIRNRNESTNRRHDPCESECVRIAIETSGVLSALRISDRHVNSRACNSARLTKFSVLNFCSI